MVSGKQGVYLGLGWLALAFNIWYSVIPSLNLILEKPVDIGPLTLTVWSVLSYVLLAILCHMISKSIYELAVVASKNNISTLLAAVIIIFGIVTLIDVSYAVLTGSSELFLVQMLYGLYYNHDLLVSGIVSSPQTIINGTLDNTTVSYAVNVTV